MKHLLLFSLIITASLLRGQSGTWVWMNGSESTNPSGNYGLQGVASVNNSPPGLYQAVQWTDKQGNFWLFGGMNFPNGGESRYCDLWKYNAAANSWTWIKGPGTPNQNGIYGTLGVPAANNNPGSRAWGCNSWTDEAGDLWLFAGYGYDEIGNVDIMDDLWRYNIASNEWTWMGGSEILYSTNEGGVLSPLYQLSDSAIPPSHDESTAEWVVNNNLWYYGGQTDSAMGQLWRYDIDSAQWAWMGPPNTSSYGTLGVESPSNAPQNRFCYTHWMEGNYLYFCGGANISEAYSDVWRFNLVNYEWTWVGGDSGNIVSGSYVNYCSTAQTNYPKGFSEQRSVQLNGCSQAMLVFGGWDKNDNTNNDLWQFNLTTLQWTWVSGNTIAGYTGNFGTEGTAAASNAPPGLAGPCFWADSSGHLWLWGGWQTGQEMMNTMWEYIPGWSCLGIDSVSTPFSYQLSSSGFCVGDSATVALSNGSGFTISPNTNVTWQDSLLAIIVPDSTTSYTISGYSGCGSYLTDTFTLQVQQASVNISNNKSIICPGDSAQICAPEGYKSYLWNTGDTTPCIITNQAGNYYVTVTPDSGCTANSNTVSLAVYSVSPVTITQDGDTLHGYNSTSYQWLLNGQPIPGADSSIFIAQTPGTYALQVTDSNGCISVSNPQIINSINEPGGNNISIYPNPTNSSWQLNVTPQLIGSVTEVYDVTGKLVFKSPIQNQQSTINIAEAARGVYVLRINAQGFSYCGKLIKM